MFDDAFTCFSDAGSTDVILFWGVVQYPGHHIATTHCSHCLDLRFVVLIFPAWRIKINSQQGSCGGAKSVHVA